MIFNILSLVSFFTFFSSFTTLETVRGETLAIFAISLTVYSFISNHLRKIIIQSLLIFLPSFHVKKIPFLIGNFLQPSFLSLSISNFIHSPAARFITPSLTFARPYSSSSYLSPKEMTLNPFSLISSL